MTDDAKAIVLLCGRFGDRDEADPLRPREYAALVRWLVESELRPADLLERDRVADAAAGSGLDESRLAHLLGRGVQLGFVVERWNQGGLWVVSRGDADYPARLKAHLREKAPPILYGAGDRALLAGGGLAIVGSRNVDRTGEEFTRDVATWCARGGVTVVSGGARGVDRSAMGAALEAGGVVIGVLADSLLRKSVARDARDGLADGRLLLVSPYHPEAGFNVGTAMARNKLIYAMADHALVVSADHGKGGTWEGATEELRRPGSRPVFVRTGPAVPAGNEKLQGLGALPFPDFGPDDDPRELLERVAADSPRPPAAAQDVFDFARGTPSPSDAATDAPVPPDSAGPAAAVPTVYEAVLPVLLAALETPRERDALAKDLDVAKGQLLAWLKHAVAEGRVEKLSGPVRYVRAGSTP